MQEGSDQEHIGRIPCPFWAQPWAGVELLSQGSQPPHKNSEYPEIHGTRCRSLTVMAEGDKGAHGHRESRPVSAEVRLQVGPLLPAAPSDTERVRDAPLRGDFPSSWGTQLPRRYRYDTAYALNRASLVAQMVKNRPAMQETQVQFLGQEDPLENEMATHSSILAWEIPWMDEPVGL